MAFNTYSFTDVNITVEHPDYTSFSMQGEGVGDITISKSTDRTSHDVAADGTVMISKIAGNNGSINVNTQQTSALHTYMQNLFNYLWSADTDKWAQISITLRAPKMKQEIICSGCAFQKEADRPYQAQGQRISWNMLAADIQYVDI